MESRVRLLVLCLVCVARVSKVLSRDITEIKAGSSAREGIEALSRASLEETDDADDDDDGQTAEKLRDKRALGLLLSGLAQIFGYTVTPVQFASLPNTNGTKPTAMTNLPVTGHVMDARIAANATKPRQQETLRFTGVVNFGNNSNIIGHLQRYEQIFHGPRNNATSAMTMTMTGKKPAAKISVDLRAQDKPPLLAPFFVKIPLPIAPELLAMPVEDVGLSNEETPIPRKQETTYRNNEETEQYTLEEKDIYDEKDVRKPTSKFNHQMYIEEPPRRKQQKDRYNKLQAEDAVKEQEGRRDRDKEIANRNREHVSTDEKRSHDDDDDEDEDSAEEERTSANRSSTQPPRKSEKTDEDYSDYDDSNKQYNGYRQPDGKYVEVGYNQQLPIGDYFHENNPEVIRDSYGEILNNKKLEDDRLTDYVTMLKQPYISNAYDSQRAQYPEDASREDEKGTIEDGYNEHLIRLQKLREEYTPPRNKYEEYDVNDERDADRGDRESEDIRNRTTGKSKRPKAEGLRGKEEVRAKSPIGSNRNEVPRDDARYVPLVVPIRYVDTNDKTQQETIQQLRFKNLDKSTNDLLAKDPTRTIPPGKLTTHVGLPERPRQLHEDERKNLQIWPSPFDYVYDNTEHAVKTIVPSNQPNYAPNYYQHVKSIAAANNDNTSEQPSGYLVIVGNPSHPYQYPSNNIYYLPNEAANAKTQAPLLNAASARDQIYASQQNAIQQFIQISPNFTGYNPNETTKIPYSYYYQTQEIPPNVPNRYRYVYEEHILQPKELFNVDVRGEIPDTENWSSKIYPSQQRDRTVKQSSPNHPQTQNVAASSQKARSRWSERPRYTQRLTKRKSSRSEEQRESDDDAKASQTIPKNKPFDDPQSAHDFFGFSKDDYNFGVESGDASTISDGNEKTAKESDVFVAPEPIAYHDDDESIMKYADEPENDTEKAKVKEYRNKIATLKVTEQRQLKPNGPIHYEKRQEIQRRNELESKMAEILENLKTRLLVE